MKIAFITESFPELSETFILRKAVELKKRGHQVTVFTQFKRSPEVHSDLLAHIDLDKEVVRLPVWDRVRPKDVARSFKGAGFKPFKSARLMATVLATAGLENDRNSRTLSFVKSLPFLREDFDIIHAHFPNMGMRYMEVMGTLNVPMVISFRGLSFPAPLMENPEAFNQIFEQAPRFIAVADYLRKLAAEHGCDPEKVYVLPTEVDTDYFRPEDRRGRERIVPVILTVGRLSWEKGYPYAMEAMARLRDQGVSFEYRVVGGGKGKAEVLAAIEDFGLEDRVKMLGPLQRNDVREQMQQADVFLLPSLVEGIGGVLLEAQATALPVVATNAGGLSEAVLHEKTGFIVPRRDPEAIALKLRILIEHPEKRFKMGDAARDWVERNFNKEKTIEELIGLYRDVIEKWGRR